MTKKQWEICGYNSDRLIYKKRIPVGCFSEKQIQEVLKALTAKASLSFDEIVGAYAKRKTQSARELLKVNKNGLGPMYTCGSNPHFVTRVVSSE